MNIKKDQFGTMPDGSNVERFTLKNSQGMTVQIITYGATISSIQVPDSKGNINDVVLGFDDLAGYQSEQNPYFGACCGRYANRIAKGTFTLEGTTYSLAINNGPNSLHGGLIGFDKKNWIPTLLNDAVEMRLQSPDGEEGYPGTLEVCVRYTLSEQNELKIDYQATTDKKTILNLTNHTYFNLAGKGTVLNHQIQINASQYAVVDEDSIPTGELRAVNGTEMDFLSPRFIGENIEQTGYGYDHNYCIDQSNGTHPVLAACVKEPTSGRTLECWTTEPGVQFYTGNYLENIAGKNGQIYNRQEGFCLETQHYPDSPNHPSFPSVILEPNQTYRQKTAYIFGT